MKAGYFLLISGRHDCSGSHPVHLKSIVEKGQLFTSEVNYTRILWRTESGRKLWVITSLNCDSSLLAVWSWASDLTSQFSHHWNEDYIVLSWNCHDDNLLGSHM